MEDFQIQPPEESEQESSTGKKFLRFGAVFLCALIGFAFMLVGYFFAIVIGLDLEVFITYTATCFLVCIVMWILIGLLTPFALFQRFFEALSGITIERVIVFVIICGTIVFLHWYVITITAKILVSIFVIE